MESKVLLITGGSGSLGQILTRQLLEYDLKAIRIFSNEEYPQYEMERQIQDSRLRFLIGDIRDKDRLSRAMNGVDIVFHLAALKHVPICEFNPFEAVGINIVGSMNVIDAAIDNKVEKVLAISSDKAVHPINIYGATKLVMEKLFIQSTVYGKTKFSCVRMGNFSESRGNVVSVWYDEIEKGEITVTDREMTRFWIGIDQAARFCIDCALMMEGGEIYIPKMPSKVLGDTIKEIAPMAKIKIIGKRSGEKLNELLLAEGEEPEEFEDYYVVRSNDNRRMWSKFSG